MGHDYVAAALDAGAAAALSSPRSGLRAHAGDGLIVVPDPLERAARRSAAARARSKALIVAVTGSAGKTTTKEAVRTVLAGGGADALFDQVVQQSLGRAADAGAPAARDAVRCSRSA